MESYSGSVPSVFFGMIRNNGFKRYVLTIFGSATIVFFIIGTLIGQINFIKWLNSVHTPFFDIVFSILTLLGTGYIFIPFVLTALFHRISIAIGLIANLLLQTIVVLLFKRILFPKAPRPINFLDPETILPIQGVDIHRWMSFPSGHTVTIFSFCVFVSLWTKKYWLTYLLLTTAFLVGTSRMYLLQHFPNDVAFGALFGTIIGVYSYQLAENWNQSNRNNQKIKLPNFSRN
ncbi:phosphatase PAP2 family protein [Aquiflexum gelatinilyticum]|uniref:phosphatase PAP2 family protein n=1 Tax=Aquiflexum gelatinilyticum TaxID=2961943 RepID=UPI002169D7CF|nr:phosphatase PAP2 family protein [Aquiflexum gelatinilyticum]MCS4436651.1 phosphatase PAP2 family protein [Aquiflexum gelatinilyticum]